METLHVCGTPFVDGSCCKGEVINEGRDKKASLSLRREEEKTLS